MSAQYENLALVKYLKSQNHLYFGKVQELREVLQGWLSHIPHTFPHYTRHTIEHSEEIILQLSKVLFTNEDPEQPKVSLSAVEAYILIAAAYLHDAGMVSSDSEKMNILDSDEWNDWTNKTGGGAKRWKEIQKFREGQVPYDNKIRNFLADVQTRFLIAEFIRLRHHLRAADVIRQHQSTMGRFAFDDPGLQEAISCVCVGHGLTAHELLNSSTYPDRRDIRGEQVNLRFMAILLRLGDLLDMSYDRACPILMNAASPVPADSYAHWTQYGKIEHRLTATDAIQITAFCDNQNEHRVLRDWCQWIVDETENANVVMSKASRHGGWQPPRASMSEPEPTITINPADKANYIPCDWVLELDRDVILDRFIYDIHGRDELFILELLQNALDATRSMMFQALSSEGIDPPESPTDVSEEIRNQFPITVELTEVEIINQLSGETEVKQEFAINDLGIGMNRKIIESYFLQIGRSYYASEEYRRKCKFYPISRFGVGFLSVFSVSDNIEVETLHSEPGEYQEALKITLAGPKSYFLLEHGKRNQPGTKISVLLRKSLEKGQLTKLLHAWCQKVEFPIIIDELGSIENISAEHPDDVIFESPDVTEEDAKFMVRSFEIKKPPIEGHLYVLAHISEKGERWDRTSWASSTYPTLHPQAMPLPPLENSYCFHGIARSELAYSPYDSSMVSHVDFRGVLENENLSRQHNFGRRLFPYDKKTNELLEFKWLEVLSQHFKESPIVQSKKGWIYKNRLVKRFPFPSFWQSEPRMIPLLVSGKMKLLDLNTVLEFDTIRIVMPVLSNRDRLFDKDPKECVELILRDTDVPTMQESDLNLIHEDLRSLLFKNRQIVKLINLKNEELSIIWKLEKESDKLKNLHYLSDFELMEYPEESIIGFVIHKAGDRISSQLVLNTNNSFVQWAVKIADQKHFVNNKVIQQSASTLAGLLEHPIRYYGSKVSELNDYLSKWRNTPNLHSDMLPPDLALTEDMFYLKSGLPTFE